MSLIINGESRSAARTARGEIVARLRASSRPTIYDFDAARTACFLHYTLIRLRLYAWTGSAASERFSVATKALKFLLLLAAIMQ